MIKKLYADGSAPKDTDQTRPMVLRVAEQIAMRIAPCKKAKTNRYEVLPTNRPMIFYSSSLKQWIAMPVKSKTSSGSSPRE